MADYKKLGLKAGLEIHQQLDTGKLFCRCFGYLRKDAPDFVVTRRLHVVAGETGEVDVAALHEASLKREFVYEGYNDTTCLIELDEEPPKKINEDALNEAIKIGLLLNCEIYPMVQIMRKTVIDGSNTSGFQRTVYIAHDGFIDTSFGTVLIDTVALEEDAARIMSKDKKSAVYRLDRLGIPLVEVTTAPDMATPEQVKETALKIGEILRACKVKRGIGTIRQDVNVSIKKHDKVEIKGFQEPRVMVKTIEFEVERQRKELQEGAKGGGVRNALKDGKTEFLRPLPGRERMYPETDLPLLKISRERINNLKKALPRLKSEMKGELRKKGVSEEMINLLSGENFEEFEMLMRTYDCGFDFGEPQEAVQGKSVSADANLVAKIVCLWRNELAVKRKISQKEVKEKLNVSILKKILEALRAGKINKRDIKEVMEKILAGMNVSDAIKTEKISDDEVEEELSKLIKENPGLRENAYMGMMMKKFGGKLNPKRAMEIVKKHFEDG